MSKAKSPKPPTALGKAGRALWRSILGDLEDGWELDARELHILERACRTQDDLALLEEQVDEIGAVVEGSRGQVVVNPALVEARQLRLVQLRLLSVIEMADPHIARQSATPAQARARHAAEVRWDLDRKKRGRRVG